MYIYIYTYIYEYIYIYVYWWSGPALGPDSQFWHIGPFWCIPSISLTALVGQWCRDTNPGTASVAFETPPEHDWLVVLTILKNISQWEGLSHILWTIKHVWSHQPDEVVTLASPSILGTYNIPRSPSKIQRYLQWKYLKWHLNQPKNHWVLG